MGSCYSSKESGEDCDGIGVEDSETVVQRLVGGKRNDGGIVELCTRCPEEVV